MYMQHGRAWSHLVITGRRRRAKASPELTNSEHVQPGHLRTMTKLVQLWTVDANRAVEVVEAVVVLPLISIIHSEVHFVLEIGEISIFTHYL